MARKILHGVQIAGLGSPDLDIVGIKTVWSWDRFIDLVALSDSEYFEVLAAYPRLASRECEPLEGLTTQSTTAFTFDQLERTGDLSNGLLGRDALAFFWVPSGVRSDAVLTQSITDAILSFTISVKTGSGAPANNAIIYIGREAMVVQSTVAGAPNEFVVNVFGRGALGTEAAAHDLRDPDVFYGVGSNPLRVDREVILYELEITTDAKGDISTTETPIFRGVVEQTRINKNLSQVSITCRDLLSQLTKQRLGADRWEGQIEMRRGSLDATGARYPYISRLPDEGSPVPYQPVLPNNNGIVGGRVGKAMHIEVDGHALLMGANEATKDIPGEPWAYRHDLTGGRVQELDGNTLDVSDDTSVYTAREILICDADNETSLFKDAAGDPTDHPADIIRNILASTGTATFSVSHTVGENGAYDWLSKPWGLSVPDALIDHDAFDLLKEIAPTGSGQASRALRARSFYVGGEDNVPGLELVFDLAQAMGCYIYLAPDQRISIRHFSDPGQGNVDHNINALQIRRVGSAESLAAEGELRGRDAVYRITFECAQKGPGGEPGTFLHAEDFGERRLQRYKYLAEEDKLETTRIYGDPIAHTLSQELLQRLVETFAFRWEYVQSKLPVYVLKLTNDAPRVVAGQWISLSHPAIYANDYTRGVENHRCFVAKSSLDLKGYAQTIHVIDMASLDLSTTLVSPSWEIVSVTNDTDFKISSDKHSDDDLAFVIDGEPTIKYHLWTADLLLRSTDGPEYMTSLIGTDVVMNAAWTAGAVPVTPLAGDIIRVADYDNRGDWSEELFPLAWICDANGKLGAANDDGYFWSV